MELKPQSDLMRYMTWGGVAQQRWVDVLTSFATLICVGEVKIQSVELLYFSKQSSSIEGAFSEGALLVTTNFECCGQHSKNYLLTFVNNGETPRWLTAGKSLIVTNDIVRHGPFRWHRTMTSGAAFCAESCLLKKCTRYS